MTRVGSTIAENEMLPQWHCPVMRIWDLFYEEPNARGKPHRSAKHVGYQQAELVGVGLTKLLG